MPAAVRVGAVLVLLGLLSFVLPLFGRQFVLVKLFGGTAVTGVLFIAAGIVVAIAGAAMHRK